jgi:hypothetical protein
VCVCVCVSVCGLQTSTMRRPAPDLGYRDKEGKMNRRVTACVDATWPLTLKKGHTAVAREQGSDESIPVCERRRKETIQQGAAAQFVLLAEYPRDDQIKENGGHGVRQAWR